MASAEVIFSNVAMCFKLTVGGESLEACVRFEDIRTAIFGDGAGVPFQIPDQPELPESLKKRMTSSEIKKWEQDCKVYKQKMMVAIRGSPV